MRRSFVATRLCFYSYVWLPKFLKWFRCRSTVTIAVLLGIYKGTKGNFKQTAKVHIKYRKAVSISLYSWVRNLNNLATLIHIWRDNFKDILSIGSAVILYEREYILLPYCCSYCPVTTVENLDTQTRFAWYIQIMTSSVSLDYILQSILLIFPIICLSFTVI